jgi:hypothetical protein
MTAMEKGDRFEVTVKVVKETKATYRCEEIGADGEPVHFKQAMLGTIYVKKELFEVKPNLLTIIVQVE